MFDVWKKFQKYSLNGGLIVIYYRRKSKIPFNKEKLCLYFATVTGREPHLTLVKDYLVVPIHLEDYYTPEI